MIMEYPPRNQDRNADTTPHVRTSRTILLVEDEAVTALAQSRAIARRGYEVVTASSGREALDAITANPSVDLVLMDIDLGMDMDGLETSRLILRQREVPIVYLTSHTEQEFMELARLITPYGYVTKCSGDGVLFSTIESALELFHSRRRSEETGESEENQAGADVQQEKILRAHQICEALRDEYLELYDTLMEGCLAFRDWSLSRKGEGLCDENSDDAHDAHYKALIETIGDGYALINDEGVVLEANQEYVRLSGLSGIEQVLDRNVVEWIASYHREKCTLALGQCLREGFIRSLQLDHIDGVGRVMPTEINATLLEESGTRQILVLCRDTTEKKATEEKLNVLAAEKEHLLREARKRIRKIFKSSLWMG